MEAEGCHSEKKKKQQTKKSSMCFIKILYIKIINKLNLLKLLKKYSEAKNYFKEKSLRVSFFFKCTLF